MPGSPRAISARASATSGSPVALGAAALIDGERTCPACGERGDLGREILLRVEDGLVGARFPRELGLLIGRHGAEHPRAANPGDLAEDQPHAAGRRVHEGQPVTLRAIETIEQTLPPEERKR